MVGRDCWCPSTHDIVVFSNPQGNIHLLVACHKMRKIFGKSSLRSMHTHSQKQTHKRSTNAQLYKVLFKRSWRWLMFVRRTSRVVIRYICVNARLYDAYNCIFNA